MGFFWIVNWKKLHGSVFLCIPEWELRNSMDVLGNQELDRLLNELERCKTAFANETQIVPKTGNDWNLVEDLSYIEFNVLIAMKVNGYSPVNFCNDWFKWRVWRGRVPNWLC